MVLVVLVGGTKWLTPTPPLLVVDDGRVVLFLYTRGLRDGQNSGDCQAVEHILGQRRQT